MASIEPCGKLGPGEEHSFGPNRSPTSHGSIKRQNKSGTTTTPQKYSQHSFYFYTQ